MNSLLISLVLAVGVTPPSAIPIVGQDGGYPVKVVGTVTATGVTTVQGLDAGYPVKVDQGVPSATPWLVTDSHSTAVSPLACRLSDGASFLSSLPITGTVNQGTQGAAGSPWFTTITDPVSSTKATVTGSNALKVDNSGVTQPVSGTVAATESGTWTVQPGNVANTTPWLVKPNDGTRSFTLKAGSTAAVAADTSEVVALSPNTPLPAGTNDLGLAHTLPGGIAYYSASSNGSVSSGTAAATVSVMYIFHPSANALRYELEHVDCMVSGATASTATSVRIWLQRITSENGTPGGFTQAKLASDAADAASGATARTVAAAPTRTSGAISDQSIWVSATATAPIQIILWDSKSSLGKGLISRASTAEGYEVNVAPQGTLTAGMQLACTFRWSEQ